MIGFRCTCGQTLQSQEDFAGRKVRCPRCRKVLTIPRQAATPRLAAAATPVDAASGARRLPEQPETGITASPWEDRSLLQLPTPWMPGDEERFQVCPATTSVAPYLMFGVLVAALIGGVTLALLFLS